MLAPGGEAPAPLALAVSVTGQQARLELRSKVANILVPNLRAHGNVVGCFLVLAQTNKMVNGAIGSDFNGTQLLVDGPHFNTTGAEVEAFIRDRVEAALPDRREALLLRTRVLPASRTPAYWGDSLWAQKYGTAGKDFDLAGQVERQQMHLDQWDHLRQTWVMIDASERRCDGGLRSAQVPCHFDCVLRLRDDTYALAPMVVPPRPARETQWGSWSSAGMLSLGCLKWGGVMDAHFLLGRQSAMAIMTGLLTDFYLEHLTATPPENAEAWLAHVADTHHVDVRAARHSPPAAVPTRGQLPLQPPHQLAIGSAALVQHAERGAPRASLGHAKWRAARRACGCGRAPPVPRITYASRAHIARPQRVLSRRSLKRSSFSQTLTLTHEDPLLTY